MVADTFTQIENLLVDPLKPLLIVDADEVLVLFASHFSTFLRKLGWDLKLKGYRLDDAIINLDDGHIANTATYQNLISSFIRQETKRQPEAIGASKVLNNFQPRANIVILTNVPNTSYMDRVTNLKNHNMRYPIISNIGPKGPALSKLKKLTNNICIFIDDNPFQINSAAQHVPDCYRFHFTACDIVKKTMPVSEGATHRPNTWPEIEKLLNKIIP